jgi:hypothetical protein
VAVLAGGSNHPAVLEAAGRVAALQLMLEAVRRNKGDVSRRLMKAIADEANKSVGPIKPHETPSKTKRRRKAEARKELRQLAAGARADMNALAKSMGGMQHLSAYLEAAIGHPSQDTPNGPHDRSMGDPHAWLSRLAPSAAAPVSAEDRIDPVYEGSSKRSERKEIFSELQNLDEYERKTLSKRRKAGFALLRALESAS